MELLTYAVFSVVVVFLWGVGLFAMVNDLAETKPGLALTILGVGVALAAVLCAYMTYHDLYLMRG